MSNEHKSVIIRTRKGNTVSCYLFLTVGHQRNKPNIVKTFASKFTKCGSDLDVSFNMGGDTFVDVKDTHPNGFEIINRFVFPREYITGIEIETDFEELRDR